MSSTVIFPTTGKCKRVVLYYMPPTGNCSKPFLVMRKSRKNKKGRYVLDDQFAAFGLAYPTSVFKSRDDLAKQIGLAILDHLKV